MATIKLYESTTLKSAQSKKCRLLAELRAKTCSLKFATLKWSHDRLLQTVCTTEELQAAADGTFAATSKRKFVTVSFTEDEAEFHQPLINQPQPIGIAYILEADTNEQHIAKLQAIDVSAIPSIDLLQTKPKTVAGQIAAAIENKYATELANEPAY